MVETLASAAPGSVADSDDISLISDDEVEVAAPSPPDARLSGSLASKAWSEVDAIQLSQLALRIAQRTLPDADKGAEPLIIASSPSDTQSLPHDPLGLGVGTSGRPLTTTGNVDDPSGWADPRLLPSSPSYDPEIHAVAAYKDIPWIDLIRGLDRLRTEVREHTGQLKSLVKENFDRFLSSKDTVDDIAMRLKAAEAEKDAGVHGGTPAEVAAGMGRSREAAHGMFGQLLDRHAKGESLRAMLGMLGEYDSLVGLPAQVRQCAEARDFAGVLTLYKKAVKVVEERSGREGKKDGEETHAVWEKLQAEVNRAMSSAVHVLVATVDSPTTPLPAASDAAYHLAQLRQAGVPAALELDPASLFLSAQVRGITAQVESYQQECISTLNRLESEFELQKRKKEGNTSSNNLILHQQQQQWQRQRQQQRHGWWEHQDVYENTLSSSEQFTLDSTLIEASFTSFWAMTESVINWLLDLSSAADGNNPSSSSSSSSSSTSKNSFALWEGSTQQTAIENSATEVLNAYSKAVEAISSSQLKSEALWQSAGLSGVAEPILSTLVAGCIAFEQHYTNSNASGTNTNTNRNSTSTNSTTKNVLQFVPGKLRHLLQQIAETAFSAIEARVTTSARQFALASLTLDPGNSFSFNSTLLETGTQSVSLPPPAASLRLLLSCGLRWAIDVQNQCIRAGTQAGEKVQPYKILCSTSMAFVEATVERIQEMMQAAAAYPPSGTSSASSLSAAGVKNNLSSGGGGGTTTGDAFTIYKDSQLLQAWEVLKSIESTVIPQVFAAFEPSLTSPSPPQKNSAATTAIKKCRHSIESLSDGIIRAYLDRKLTLLDGIMEDFLSPIVPESAAETEITVDAAAFTEACALVANWNENFAPTHARPIVWTLLCTLGGIRTELLAYSPSLCKDVMLEILQGVIGGVTELLESGFIETSPIERVYQLWVDVTVLQFAVKKLGEDGDRVEEDVDKLCHALESAFSAGLKRCGEDCRAYLPPQTAISAAGGGDGSGGNTSNNKWTVSMGDHRRWVQKVCDMEVKKADTVMKAFSPQQQF